MTTTAFSWNDDLVAAAQAATQRQFEHLNPANSLFSKYYHLYSNCHDRDHARD